MRNGIAFRTLVRREILRYFVAASQTLLPPLLSSSLFMSRWHNLIQELLLSPLSYLEMVPGLLVGGVTRGIPVGSGVPTLSLLFARECDPRGRFGGCASDCRRTVVSGGLETAELSRADFSP